MTELDHHLPAAEAGDASSRRRGGQRSIGELVVDLVLVAGIGGYLYTAQSYPPDGRQIPTVVGIIGLVAALIQLIGWFVRPMWTFTHGNAPSKIGDTPEPGTPPPTAAAAAEDTRTETEPAAPPKNRSRDTVIIMAWAAGFLGAILAIGYEYGVPLFFLVYFLSRRSWKLAIILAVVMWAVARFIFIDLLTIPLPSGELF